MFTNLLFLALFTSFISQSCKYILRITKEKKMSLAQALHVYFIASGKPSSHAAVLTATSLYIGVFQGFDSILFFISFFSSFLWLFEIYMQRRRSLLLASVLGKNITKNEKELLEDLSGHNLSDIVIGIGVGSITYLICYYFIFK